MFTCFERQCTEMLNIKFYDEPAEGKKLSRQITQEMRLQCQLFMLVPPHATSINTCALWRTVQNKQKTENSNAMLRVVHCKERLLTLTKCDKDKRDSRDFTEHRSDSVEDPDHRLIKCLQYLCFWYHAYTAQYNNHRTEAAHAPSTAKRWPILIGWTTRSTRLL